METREYRNIDKANWGQGPWQDEPDKKQWRDETTGLPCLLVRNPRGGNLCGYVGVNADHPAHGLPYSDWRYGEDDDRMPLTSAQESINAIEVHGGLTFSDGCGHGGDESVGICHVPGAGEPDDAWWFGFDCAHAWDKRPGYDARHPEWRDADARYRTAEYVQAECAKLASQLLSIGVSA